MDQQVIDSALIDILVDPTSRSPLTLERGVGEAVAPKQLDRLRGANGCVFPIVNGIPRFVLTEDAGQRQTQQSFGFKWKRRQDYDSDAVTSAQRAWMSDRYGFASDDAMRTYFASRNRILDAGCGNGFSSSTWLDDEWRRQGRAQWFGMDISEAVDVARQRLGHVPGTYFVQGDVLQPPFAEGAFDTVFSEGVLHHTPSTRAAINSTAKLLKSGGEFLFYVYRKKGPIREFTDDHVRDVVSQMPEEQAFEALKPLTRLGQALAELNMTVDVPEDIPYLGIKAGKQDVQRLIYWNIAKLFWNPAFSFDENHLVNFDWYHPRYAHRQTAEQVREWCAECRLNIRHFCEQESGITVVAVKD